MQRHLGYGTTHLWDVPRDEKLSDVVLGRQQLHFTIAEVTPHIMAGESRCGYILAAISAVAFCTKSLRICAPTFHPSFGRDYDHHVLGKARDWFYLQSHDFGVSAVVVDTVGRT